MRNLNLFTTTTTKHVDNAYAEHMLDFLYPNFNLEAGKYIACGGRFNMVKSGRNRDVT